MIGFKQLNSGLLKTNWQQAWKEVTFRSQLLLTLFVGIFLYFIISKFLTFIETRPGQLLDDPLLKRLEVQDMSWYTFLILYGAITTAVIHLAFYPRYLLMGMQAFCVVSIMRIFAIFLFPLEPSPLMIHLQDPVLNYIIADGKLISKDLFFSGHTSMMFLLFMAVRNRILKIIFFILTIVVAVLLLVQHVHYTIDVICAPFFTWISYKMAEWATPNRTNF